MSSSVRSDPTDQGVGVIAIGLEQESGVERYRTTIESAERLSGSVRDIFSNGRYVIIRTTFRLVALEPASGEIAWSL